MVDADADVRTMPILLHEFPGTMALGVIHDDNGLGAARRAGLESKDSLEMFHADSVARNQDVERKLPLNNRSPTVKPPLNCRGSVVQGPESPSRRVDLAVACLKTTPVSVVDSLRYHGRTAPAAVQLKQERPSAR